MKVLIAIPSHQRPYDIEKRTGFWLKALKKTDWKVFVESDQIKYYEQIIPKSNLISTPVGSGLIGQLIEIGNYASKNNYDLVMKMDDDMRLTKTGLKKENTADFIEEMIEYMISQFDSNTGAITAAKPMGYLHGDKKSIKLRNKPIFGNYLIRTGFFSCLKPEYLLFDDLVFSAQIKLNGMVIKTNFAAMEDSLTHKNKGGLQTIDRDLYSRKGFQAIIKDFPLMKELPDNKNNCFDIDASNYFIK
jgi:hypothetical protein